MVLGNRRIQWLYTPTRDAFCEVRYNDVEAGPNYMQITFFKKYLVNVFKEKEKKRKRKNTDSDYC
jgi:hypothetical protein